jgi:hypothetical protein
MRPKKSCGSGNPSNRFLLPKNTNFYFICKKKPNSHAVSLLVFEKEKSQN